MLKKYSQDNNICELLINSEIAHSTIILHGYIDFIQIGYDNYILLV